MTSSRMPFALDVIRKLGERGHEVFACDSYDASPGSHSKYLAGHFTTASATGDPAQFASDVERIADINEIETVVPMFEEVFYLAAQHERLSKVTKLYAPPFQTLAQVHDKGTFQELCDRLEIRTPHTTLAHSARGAEGGRRELPALLRPRRLLAWRRRPVHQHRAARRSTGVRRLPADRGEPLVGPGVRRRADALHLLGAARRQGRHAHVLPGAPPVGALDRHPVPLGRSRGHAAHGRETRQGPLLGRADVARLHRDRRRPGDDRMQSAPHRRRPADDRRGARTRPARAAGRHAPGPRGSHLAARLRRLRPDLQGAAQGDAQDRSTTWRRSTAPITAGATRCRSSIPSWRWPASRS